MKKIFGLLLKDILELKSYTKNFLFSIIIYIIILLLNIDNNEIFFLMMSMIIFLFCIYAMATFGYDEKSKSNQYYLSLPISRKEIVLSKYLLIIFSILCGILLSLTIGIVLSIINLISNVFSSITFPTILGIIFALSIIQCIQIPFIFKYGYEKGKLQIYIIAMVIFAIIGGLYMLFPNVDLSIINKYEILIPYLLIFITVINYYISYKISLHIFNKKEF